MPKTPDFVTETTATGIPRHAFDSAWNALSIRGQAVLRLSGRSPWASAMPEGRRLAKLVDASARQWSILLHLAERGTFELASSSGGTTTLLEGDMAVCIHGPAHVVSSGEACEPHAFSNWIAHLTDRRPHEPLRRALDRPMPGDTILAGRLIEMLCAEAIRVHIASVASEQPGWFRGLGDPIIERAMAAIHARPGDDWTVRRLADLVSMSPSRFTVRFVEAVGINPMTYATHWRMGIACHQLAGTNDPIERIARRIGYGNVKAFEYAFKRRVGVRPETWRARGSD